MPPMKQKATILQIIDQAELVKTFRLKPEKPLSFKPGQFITVFAGNASGAGAASPAKAYSISSPPGKEYIDLTVKMVGRFPEGVFAKLKAGDAIEFLGPSGVFVFDKEKIKKPVFLAAGIGITPFMSMLEYIKSNGLETPAVLFYSNRTVAGVAFLKRLEELDGENIKIVNSITRETPDRWKGELERINIGMIRKYVDVSDKDCTFYLCGSAEFVRELVQQLIDSGVEKERIIKEEF